MAPGAILAHIVHREGGFAEGVWAGHVLRTAFQPIFAFEDGQLVATAYEGLLRPFRNGAEAKPVEFFNSVPAGDRFAVETLARNLHLLNAGHLLDRNASIFINFDPSLFPDRAVARATLRDMRLVLGEAGIEPSRVVCELTEQPACSYAALSVLVEVLREGGLRIAVDDFGAHDSDMNRVAQIHPDIVKFDARWLTRLMESGPGQALLALMVERFSDHGIATVFEGIEEQWQLELAEEAGAAMVQGHLLARPQIVPTDVLWFATRFESGIGMEGRHAALTAPPGGARKSVRGVAFGRRTGPDLDGRPSAA